MAALALVGLGGRGMWCTQTYHYVAELCNCALQVWLFNVFWVAAAFVFGGLERAWDAMQQTCHYASAVQLCSLNFTGLVVSTILGLGIFCLWG